VDCTHQPVDARSLKTTETLLGIETAAAAAAAERLKTTETLLGIETSPRYQ